MNNNESIEYRPSGRYAWAVFAVMFALMVVDFVDRQVVVSMFPHLKATWDLTDAQLGALVSVVSITIAAATVPLSFLADRYGRVKSVVLMALVWSGATIACAFAERYAHLLVARAVIGLGEAAYGSIGAALLASVFPARLRSTVLGAFLAAGVLGSVLGVALGGIIAQHWSWRAGFGVVGVPGAILALVFILIVRDYSTVELPTAERIRLRRSIKIRALILALLGPRTVLVACVAGGLQLITVSTIYAWMPTYLNRFYGIAPDEAGLTSAFLVLTSGIGAVLCAIAADRWSSRLPAARLYVPALAAVASAALMYIAFAQLAPGNAQFAVIVAGAAIMTGTVGPVAAAVIDVSHPALRATAASVLALTQNLFGLAAGPLITGFLSDMYELPFAMSVLPIFSLLAAAMFVRAAHTYELDLTKVAHIEATATALSTRQSA